MLSRAKFFYVFWQKIKRAAIFYLLANLAETAYLSVQDGELSNAVWLVEFRPRKVAVHTFVGVVQSRAAQTAFVQELSKAIIFCLRSNPGEISHSNSPNRELSNDFSDAPKTSWTSQL